MDGIHVNTSPLQRIADYATRAAIAAGYNVDVPNSGARGDLATAAGMTPSAISRLLNAQRMPEPKYFLPLARALKVDPLELLAQASEEPTETPSQTAQLPVPSLPLTPDDVADAWKVDPFGREMVHAMFERLTTKPQLRLASDNDDIEGTVQ